LVTLIRHGQAGSRVKYDDLSEAGCEQSRALGKWFGERRTRFDAIVTGGLNRQMKTAREMVSAIRSQSMDCPEPEVDRRWNEFDLDEVYAGIGPLLAREDEQFRCELEQLVQDMADPDSPSHRAWRNCDVMVVRTWIEARFEFAGESYHSFRARVQEAFRDLPASGLVAVVTSATPIGVCVGTALGLAPERVMQLAAGFNSSFSEIRLRRGNPLLVSFNNVPHLGEERLRTLR
jgi:broad specificity phosphatase PhoE